MTKSKPSAAKVNKAVKAINDNFADIPDKKMNTVEMLEVDTIPDGMLKGRVSILVDFAMEWPAEIAVTPQEYAAMGAAVKQYLDGAEDGLPSLMRHMTEAAIKMAVCRAVYDRRQAIAAAAAEPKKGKKKKKGQREQAK